MTTYKMPERTDRDGQVSVSRDEEDGSIVMVVGDHGKLDSLRCSEYNAWRLFGMLSVMLGLPLSKAAGKAIKFGDKPPEMVIGRGDRSKMSLGQKLAASLADEMLKEELAKQGIEMVPVAPVLPTEESSRG